MHWVLPTGTTLGKPSSRRRYVDLQKRIDGFMSGEVDQMIKQLNDLARRLDEIRNIRL